MSSLPLASLSHSDVEDARSSGSQAFLLGHGIETCPCENGGLRNNWLWGWIEEEGRFCVRGLLKERNISCLPHPDAQVDVFNPYSYPLWQESAFRSGFMDEAQKSQGAV